jgi:hypothetical protein
MSLSLDEFLRRILLHLLPKGFVRIRNFGFLAKRRRATPLPRCFQLLGSGRSSHEENRSNRPLDRTVWASPEPPNPYPSGAGLRLG